MKADVEKKTFITLHMPFGSYARIEENLFFHFFLFFLLIRILPWIFFAVLRNAFEKSHAKKEENISM